MEYVAIFLYLIGIPVVYLLLSWMPVTSSVYDKLLPALFWPVVSAYFLATSIIDKLKKGA
jgi:hypothetical protein